MTWFAGVASLAVSLACGAPRAAPIEGDISTTLDRALDGGTERFDHGVWNDLLSRYGKQEGRRFDYAGLKTEEPRFEQYLDSLREVDLASLSSPEVKALFINAYNAYTIRTVLDRVRADGTYDIESIRDVPDVFGVVNHEVGGYSLSLDNMEHNILRPLFKDPRVHFAVNCASISCPPLPLTAFTGADVDDELERATGLAIRNPDYVAVEDGSLRVTKILEWYGGDFTNQEFHGSEETLPLYLHKYATEEVRQFIDAAGDDVPLSFRDYDWRLNRFE